MQKIDEINITTAKTTEEIFANIRTNVNKYNELTDSKIWREETPIAIVGGGPSLKDQLDVIHRYKFVVACGSVHDYLIENRIFPDYCVVCDPDELMANYLQKPSKTTTYLLASQCAPKVFEQLKDYNKLVWHAGGYVFGSSPFGENKVGIGGGCTVGTRAICIALGMGFTNIHLFGFDTCLSEDFRHHAYEFVDKEKETIGNITEIRLGDPVNGKKFYVAGYHLGQLFDFQKILGIYADRLNITIHGGGLLSELIELAKIKALENKNDN